MREAERSQARRLGVRLPPRTPWEDQRMAIADALLSHRSSPETWPPRGPLRRSAWQLLDHAWELNHKSRL